MLCFKFQQGVIVKVLKKEEVIVTCCHATVLKILRAQPSYVNFFNNSETYSCQYRMIRDIYHIVYKKFCIVRAYRKCSWIVWYIGVYRMNRVVSVNCTYRTIHRHMGLKWVFLLKFVILFDLNKLLDFVNTKIIGTPNWASLMK